MCNHSPSVPTACKIHKTFIPFDHIWIDLYFERTQLWLQFSKSNSIPTRAQPSSSLRTVFYKSRRGVRVQGPRSPQLRPFTSAQTRHSHAPLQFSIGDAVHALLHIPLQIARRVLRGIAHALRLPPQILARVLRRARGLVHVALQRIARVLKRIPGLVS